MYFNRYDICEAYYFFLSDTHTGQFSTKYKRLSKLTKYFKPSLLAKEPTTENAKEIYAELLHKWDVWFPN